MSDTADLSLSGKLTALIAARDGNLLPSDRLEAMSDAVADEVRVQAMKMLLDALESGDVLAAGLWLIGDAIEHGEYRRFEEMST